MQTKYFAGLFQLRFLLALCVTIGHCELGINLNGWVTNETPIGAALRLLAHNLFAGPAAVIAFFVISGFCIHLPDRTNRPLELKPYLLRRFVRIGIPMVASLVLARLVGVKLGLLDHSILWSLICEEIYYLLYPALRLAAQRLTWHRLIAAAYVASFGVILTNPRGFDYPSYGWQLNWLLGLPCWLLGCWLAERSDNLPIPNVALWRVITLGSAWLCSAVRFHSPVGYPWTLNLFALVVFVWLHHELAYYQTHQPNRILESAGQWSYSLYLTHVQGQALWLMLGLALPLILRWPLHLGFLLLFSYAFYRLVERPSHNLARRLAN